MRNYDKEELTLNEIGCNDVKFYMLCNNDGYTFNSKDKTTKYDLRHWANNYGVEVDYWTVSSKAQEDKGYDHYKRFDEFADAVEYLKGVI